MRRPTSASTIDLWSTGLKATPILFRISVSAAIPHRCKSMPISIRTGAKVSDVSSLWKPLAQADAFDFICGLLTLSRAD